MLSKKRQTANGFENNQTIKQFYQMKTIKGDLIQLALANEFDVIIHGCNCFCTMGKGIAPMKNRSKPH